MASHNPLEMTIESRSPWGEYTHIQTLASHTYTKYVWDMSMVFIKIIQIG